MLIKDGCRSKERERFTKVFHGLTKERKIYVRCEITLSWPVEDVDYLVIFEGLH